LWAAILRAFSTVLPVSGSAREQSVAIVLFVVAGCMLVIADSQAAFEAIEGF
jgi:hypothetical protein